jgi:iron complex outermembrane receptor protein
VADKRGAKFTYVRPDTFMQGLETTVGLDVLQDNTQQRLATTGRTWVPPLDFSSTAPFVQVEYETGPVTLRGGLRREFAKLQVDTYTTLAAYGSQQVQGGSTSFSETVKNLGAVWRFMPGWSAFVSSSEGFGLPDAGLVLRGVNRPGQSVATLIDLQPIITRNNEIGVTWRGAMGNVGLSYYDSRSDLGSVIRVTDGVGRIDRVPTQVKGWELVGELKVNRSWSVFGSYAITRGKTATAQDQPLDVELGARNQAPDKLVLGTNWKWTEKANLRLQATKLFDRDINVGRFAGATSLEEHFDGYMLVDAAANWNTRYGKFGVGLENIFDKQYIGYYSQSAPTSPLINTFAGRGRTLSVSWSQTF